MYEFKSIGLWGRLADAKVAATALKVIAHLKARNLHVLAPLSARDIDHSAPVELLDEADIAARAELIVAVGGDGTLLHAARRVAGLNVPLVGINLGRLGFLTDVLPDEMLRELDAILAGECIAEERRMLEAAVLNASGESPPTAVLNDVTLQKCETGRMLDFTTAVDGSYVNTHSGDGLIVATPTGSTAYALSCGGPIIQPEVDALVMVPICPHTLSDRPLVLKGSSVIEVQLQPAQSPAQVTCDGEVYGLLEAGEKLRIRAARETITLLHPRGYNYYELLRSKLNWGGTRRFGRPL